MRIRAQPTRATLKMAPGGSHHRSPHRPHLGRNHDSHPPGDLSRVISVLPCASLGNRRRTGFRLLCHRGDNGVLHSYPDEHSTAEIVRSYHDHQGDIDVRSFWWKLLAAVTTVSSGGSGAAAGMAAVFGVPLTGLVFALEMPCKDDLAREAPPHNFPGLSGRQGDRHDCSFRLKHHPTRKMRHYNRRRAH
jgi:hypothetical protein